MKDAGEKLEVDVLVVGAGPGGIGAALEAHRGGLEVLVVDENDGPGGQIHRQLSGNPRRAAPRSASPSAIRLLSAFADSGIKRIGGATAWASFEPGSTEVVAGRTNFRVRFRAMVVATGACDRPYPVPGWTLPGVFTAGGAQALLKSQGILPGRRVLLAGAGPLQLVVASQLARSGAGVVAVAEAVSTVDVLRSAHRLVGGGRLLLDALRYRADVARARIPWISPAAVVEIGGGDRVEFARVAILDRGWRPIPGSEETFEVDAVCLGYGLVPSTELVRGLGCKMRFDGTTGGWLPSRDENCETSVRGIFAVGDGAEISGAWVALDEGRLVGRVLASRLNGSDSGDQEHQVARSIRYRLRRRRRFATAIREVYRIPDGHFARPAGDTVICRCEDVPAHRIRTAILAGASDLKSLKVRTRVGMGPCQGRMCEATARAMLSAESGASSDLIAGLPPREPVRPVPVAAFLQPAPPPGQSFPGGSDSPSNQ